MATRLEQSTQKAKKLGIGCGILIVIIIVVNFVSGFFKPEPPDLPIFPVEASETFGTLPNINFSTLALAEDADPEYRIDTIDGTLPYIPTIINVYKTKTPHQSLTAQDDAVNAARDLQFTTEPIVVSDKELKWKREATTLTINKLYETVTIDTNLQKDERALQDHEIEVDYNIYINSARSHLQAVDLYTEGLGTAKSTFSYLKLDNNFNFVQANSASEADFVRVDFFEDLEIRSPIPYENLTEEQEEYIQERMTYGDIHNENPHEGLAYVIMCGISHKDIIEMKVTDWEIEQKSTYEAIPVETAWEKVANGEGYLRSLYETNADIYTEYEPLAITTFLLTNVEILYFSPRTYTEPLYIQPVYKFSGVALQGSDTQEANFIYYYPAIAQSGEESPPEETP